MSTNPGDPPAPEPERRETAPRPRSRRADVMDLLDALQRKAPEQQKFLVNAIGMKLVLIPAGVFWLGSPDEEEGRRSNEGPRRETAITAAFYLGAFPVTQGQYQQVTQREPVALSRRRRRRAGAAGRERFVG